MAIAINFLLIRPLETLQTYLEIPYSLKNNMEISFFGGGGISRILIYLDQGISASIFI